MTDEPGLGEIARSLQALRSDVQSLSGKLEAGYVRKDVQDAREAANSIQLKGIEDEMHATNKRIDSVNQRIDKIEERLTAHFRLMLGQLIFPIIVAIVVFILIGTAHPS